MKKLDRFILKAFIGPFVAILAVVVFVLMMQFLWLYIDELVGKGLGLLVILEFLMWGACTILPLAMPLATLVSSVMVVGQMGEHKELMAIKAAGVSFGRVMKPLVIISIVITVGAYFIGDRLVPIAFNKIYTLRDDISKTKSEIKIPSGTFYDGIEGYILRADGQNNDTGMLYGVMVYDHTKNGGNTNLTIADSSLIKLSKNKDYLTFTLYNGINYQETNTLRYADTSFVLRQVKFDRQELLVPLKNYRFEKSDSSHFGDQTKSIYAKELKHNKDSLDTAIDSLVKANHTLLRKVSIFQQYRQLDTAFRDPSREMFQAEGYLTWENVNARKEAYIKANQNATRYASEVNNFIYSTTDKTVIKRYTAVELLKRFSQALACLLMLLIGAPMGALIRKGDLGTSVVISAFFFVLYWVIDISGTKLANDGATAPMLGVFISAMVLAPIGIFLSRKAIKDADLFNMDQIKTGFKKLYNKIYHHFRPVRIVYMGTPEFAVKPLDTLVKNGYKVVGVVTVADKASGRGLKVNESAVKQYAVEHGIPVLQPVKLKDPEFLKALRAWKADLFVVVAFRMLPEEVWKMPRLGTFNLHAALLPQYRGAAPINWAVINGERRTGVTTFMIDKDIDTGGIMLRQDCPIGPEENVGDIHDKLMDMGADLVLHTVEGLVDGNIETRTQRSFIQGSEVLKPAPKLTRELCHIDWDDRTKTIYNLIRGLSPYPAAFTEIVPVAGGNPQVLKIYRAHPVDLSGKPGEILTDGKNYLAIATADGALSIDEMQLAGKKRMDARSFLLGFRNPSDYSCTQGTSKKTLNNVS